MEPELLVRLYNVGLGDCIYVRIPDQASERHVLIDCGNKFGKGADLERAISHLEADLPAEPSGKKQLDLLVVSHPHEDHLKGFDTELFENFHIHRIWLSPSMNPTHPQAKGLRSVQSFADRALSQLRSLPLGTKQVEIFESMFELNKKTAVAALLEGLPQANGNIKPEYVHANTPPGDLLAFNDGQIQLQVLGPMEDIDLFYLGKTAADVTSLRALGAVISGLDVKDVAGAPSAAPTYPPNISRSDFDQLRTRLLSNAIAFTLKSGELVNNTSIVLLLEWKGRRLLFPGDAQVKTSRAGKFEKGKSNGAWNVMWAMSKDALNASLDFLKVGHHGSHNATPWTSKKVRVEENGQEVEKPHPVNEILDAMLPEVDDPRKRKGRAIVSTRRTNAFEKIPDPELIETLGKRVANVEQYTETPVHGVGVGANVDQPWRTDLKRDGSGKALPFLELRFKALT